VLLLLTYGKDILGLLGTILVTIPFFKDWRAKQRVEEARPGADLEGEPIRIAYGEIEKKLQNQFFTADKGDLLLISVGLGLVSLSFVFSLILTYID
jgi:hypothetical protein